MIATRDSFDEQLTDNERQQFWALVRDTLRVFDADPRLADEYRHELEHASVGERIAAYHASPLTIAAALNETGDATVAPSLGEQTFMPLLEGAEHPLPAVTVISRVAYTWVPAVLYATKISWYFPGDNESD